MPSIPNPRPARASPSSLLIAGAAAAFLPAAGGLPLFGYLSIALLLAGGVAAMPLLARLLLAPLQRLAFAVPAHLASKHLWGAPSQAAIALCGIVASTSLMIAMAVMVSSFRGSVDAWLVQILPADIYLRVEGDDTSALSLVVQGKLAATPGIAAIHFRKITPLRLSPEQTPIVWLAEDIDSADPGRTLPLIGASLTVPPGATPVWLSEPATWLYRYRAGESIDLPLGRHRRHDKGFRRRHMARLWASAGNHRDGRQGLYAAHRRCLAFGCGGHAQPRCRHIGCGRGDARARCRLRSLRASVSRRRASCALSLRDFRPQFRGDLCAGGIAILVGLAGVAATFSAQTLARTKEFGMLRHIGVLRRQIVVMLAAEGALLGAVGVVAGIGLGVAISQVLIHVINPQSFHWTMETRLPWAVFAGVTVALMVASAGTALLAGRRALSSDAVRAVREDW